MLQALAPVMAVLLIGRVIGGAGIGILSAVVPIFISEMSPEHFRGRLSTLWQVCIHKYRLFSSLQCTEKTMAALLIQIPLSKCETCWRI